MPKQAMDYSKTIIYKITCNDATVLECYVGHTTSFKDRKCNHKKYCNNLQYNQKLYQMIREHGGWDNWMMFPICEYPCENYIQACIKEEEYRIELQANLNMRKCHIELSKNEYDKQRREEKKEQLKEYEKQRNQNLKRKEQQKQSQEKNKEKITCKCGTIFCKGIKARHERSKKHQNFILNSNSNGEKY